MLIEYMGKPALRVTNPKFRYVSHAPEGLIVEIKLDDKTKFELAGSPLTVEQVLAIYEGRKVDRLDSTDSTGKTHKYLKLWNVIALDEFE